MAEWLRGRERYVLVSIILGAAALTALLLYSADHYVFVYLGDASSHIVRTRQFVDSQQPGIENLGTGWLPLPHLLLLPFASIDFLFYSGLAGIVPGVACLIGTVLAVFGIVRWVTGSERAALVGGLIFGLNPNVVYLSLTPMSEPSFLFFFALSAYGLLRWLEDPGGLRWLALASATACCATLCRYETWVLPAYLALAVLLLVLTRKLPRGGFKIPAAILLALGSFTGVAAWMVWNAHEYGSLLHFAGAIRDIGPAESRGALTGKPIQAILLFGKTALYIFGPFLMGLAAFAFVRRKLSLPQLLLYGFMALPVVFTLTALTSGYAQMDQWWWNSRYALPLALLLSVAGSAGLTEWWNAASRQTFRLAPVAALFSFCVVQVTVPAIGVATYLDGVNNFFDRSIYATELGEQLGEMYNGGTIALMTGYAQGHRIMIPSHIPINRFRVEMEDRGGASRALPWENNRYVILSKQPAPEVHAYVSYWLHHVSQLFHYYSVIGQNRDFMLMERKEDRLIHDVSVRAGP